MKIHDVKNYIYSILFFNGLLSWGRPRVYSLTLKKKKLFLSNTVDITHLDKVTFGDNVFIWHHTILDSFNRISIGEGTQIGAQVGVFTHSSHNSIRYYGSDYNEIPFYEHKGRIKGSVNIGEYVFIGANSIIMPGTVIGKGSIVSAFSYVSGKFPDFSIIGGNPAKRIGDVRRIDRRFLKKHRDLIPKYLQAMSIDSEEELFSEK